MIIKDWKKDLFTIPNWLSFFRLVLIPVYVIIYLRAEDMVDYAIAAGILAVSCLTDMIDGKIARQFNQITTVGKILDPFADKATQFSLILCLSAKYSVLWYLVALFVAKESFMLIAGGIRFKKGRMLKGALMSGKVCTTVLFVSLILLVLLPELQTFTINIIALIDTLFMFFAFADYVLAYIRFDSKFQSIDPYQNEM